MTNHGQRENGRKPPVSILELLGQACVEHDGPVEIRARLDGDPDSDLVWEPVQPGEGFDWLEADRKVPTVSPDAKKIHGASFLEMLEERLAAANGIRATAASMLGISDLTLKRWLAGSRPANRTLDIIAIRPATTSWDPIEWVLAARMALQGVEQWDDGGTILVVKKIGDERIVIGRPWRKEQ